MCRPSGPLAFYYAPATEAFDLGRGCTSPPGLEDQTARYCLLPIAYCLLPIAYCLLPIAYCLMHNPHNRQSLANTAIR